MMYLLRAFSLPKWSLNLDKTLNNFETDPITVCTRTKDNELSVWLTDSTSWTSELTKKIITAFAVNKDAPATTDFIFLDGEFLRGKGVKISEKEAETPYTSMNSYHRDLSDLTYEKIGIVCEHLVEQLKVDTNIFRLEKADMVKWVVDVYSAEEGLFDLDDLSDKWQKAINRELDARKVIV